MKTHKDLDVWKQSIALSKDIYELTRGYPKEEMFGLVSQMRRAAVSIASNIAEGAARRGNKEFSHFLYIAVGSVTELETQLEISKEVGLGEKHKIEGAMQAVDRLQKMIHGLIRSVKAQETK